MSILKFAQIAPRDARKGKDIRVEFPGMMPAGNAYVSEWVLLTRSFTIQSRLHLSLWGFAIMGLESQEIFLRAKNVLNFGTRRYSTLCQTLSSSCCSASMRKNTTLDRIESNFSPKLCRRALIFTFVRTVWAACLSSCLGLSGIVRV